MLPLEAGRGRAKGECMAVVGFKGDDTKPEDKERGGFERKEAWMSLGLKAESV